mmetsp:Transcript_57068/g.100194  ORF Transcript_57068/g.100194 Transcript_57068/m.100194 type:complete len:225 (+) Transcript_57068:120-794(+)
MKLRNSAVAVLLQTIGLNNMVQRRFGLFSRFVCIVENVLDLDLLFFHEAGQVRKHLIHLHQPCVHLFDFNIALVDDLLHHSGLVNRHEFLHYLQISLVSIDEQALVRVHTSNVVGALKHRWVESISATTLDPAGPTAAASRDWHPEGRRPVSVLSVQLVQARHRRGAQERVAVVAWARWGYTIAAAPTCDEAPDPAQVWCGTGRRRVATGTGADETAATGRGTA